MRIIVCLFLIIISVPTSGQENETFLKNWKVYPVPTNEEMLTKYNLGQNYWVVFLDQNEARVDHSYKYCPTVKLPFAIKQSESDIINISAPLAGLIDAFEVDDGYLVAFNRGEWGGELYWFSKDGKKKYEISKQQITKFIERDDKIYAIEGISHLGMSKGGIIEVKKKKRKWKTTEYLKLPTAPEAAQLDSKNNLVVVTSSGIFLDSNKNFGVVPSSLLSIDSNANVDTLVKAGMWDYLYPSSLIIQDDIVYIGMKRGVYKFDLVTKKEEWLLPE